MASCSECHTNLVPEARFCSACGSPVTVWGPHDERKLATIVFADLVASTELVTQDPERVRGVLDRFYVAMETEVTQAGGTVEKFIGDAVMAAFGAPVAYEDHAERALQAALAMRERLNSLFGDQLAIRIGVNTGEVVVGGAKRESSFVTGEAVNLAARLEQAAAPGEILVGVRTVAAARGAFEFGEPRTVQAKGKPDGIPCRPLGRARSWMRAPLGALPRVFLGRDQEIDLLRSAYERAAREARPQLVTVVGDAGVGKTRLAREFWGWLGGQSPEPVLRTGRCMPYGPGITYRPLAEVLREQMGFNDNDPPTAIVERLEPRPILGLTLGLDVAHDLHPFTARDRLHQAWISLLDELARDRPVVLLLEDLHWAEEPLLDLIEQMVQDVRGSLLVIATSRPELLDSHPRWSARRSNATILPLEALSLADTEQLLRALLRSPLPAALHTQVVERSEGNPFFLEELVASLIDRGILQRQDEGWVTTSFPPDYVIPDSVQAVLAARLDLLRPVEKAALQAAAVIGRVFWLGPVFELIGQLAPDVRTLEERHFIRRRPASSIAGEREFTFKHALTRQVAYASLPKARRARLHADFARWLERTGKGRDDYAPLLAHHFAEAVTPSEADIAWGDAPADLAVVRQRALFWLRRAADLAIGRYAIEEAIALLHRALALEPPQAEQTELWRAIGRVQALRMDGEAFWQAMHQAIELAPSDEMLAELYSELAMETADRWAIWKRMPDRELVEGWIARAIDLASAGSAARARALTARAYWNPADASAAASEASHLADALGDVRLRSYAYAARTLSALVAGDNQEALRWSQRRLSLRQQITDADHLTDLYVTAIQGLVNYARFAECRELAAQHEAVATQLSDHHQVHGVAVMLEVEELAGAWDTIDRLRSRTSEVVAANLSTPCVRNARSLLICALAAQQLGSPAAAKSLESQARELGMEGYGPSLDPLRLRLALARGDLDEVARLLPGLKPPLPGKNFFRLTTLSARLDALTALRRSDQVPAEAGPLLQPNTYLEPFALRALGMVSEDAALMARAQQAFQALGLHWHAAQTGRLLTHDLKPA